MRSLVRFIWSCVLAFAMFGLGMMIAEDLNSLKIFVILANFVL